MASGLNNMPTSRAKSLCDLENVLIFDHGNIWSSLTTKGSKMYWPKIKINCGGQNF